MKIKLLAVAAAVGATVLTGCATSQHSDTVSRAKYNTEIAKRDAELATLRGQTSASSSTTTTSTSSAPSGNLNTELFPPNAKPGHCYARLLTPATYETTNEKVLVREASETVQVVPATYKTVQDRVLVREESTRVEAIPATFKTVTEQLLVGV